MISRTLLMTHALYGTTKHFCQVNKWNLPSRLQTSTTLLISLQTKFVIFRYQYQYQTRLIQSFCPTLCIYCVEMSNTFFSSSVCFGSSLRMSPHFHYLMIFFLLKTIKCHSILIVLLTNIWFPFFCKHVQLISSFKWNI